VCSDKPNQSQAIPEPFAYSFVAVVWANNLLNRLDQTHDETDSDKLADEERNLARPSVSKLEHFLPLAELKQVHCVFLLQDLQHL
jgi:hypothetical protein